MIDLLAQAAEGGGGIPIDLTALGVAAIGAIGGFLGYRNSSIARKEQTRLDRTKVDAEAYERARAIDQSVIDNLRNEIDRLRRELNEAEATEEALRTQVNGLRLLELEVRKLKDSLTSERSVSERLRNQVAELERRVSTLIGRLIELGHHDAAAIGPEILDALEQRDDEDDENRQEGGREDDGPSY